MTENLEFQMKKQHIFYILLAFIVIISVLPWFKEGVAVTDDFRHHITKFWYVQYSFQHSGGFTEWMPFIYSGWPLTHFYHSLPYFLSLPFILIMKPVASLKASIVASFILSALAMFYASRKLFKNNQAAVIAAIFYIFAPLHFEFAYLSGSITRLWAYIFLPLAIAYFIALVEEGGKKNLIAASIFIAALAYTSVNITIAMTYFMVIYLIYHFFIREKKIAKSKIKELLLCIILILGLSAIWMIPYALENQDSSTARLTDKIFGDYPGATKTVQVFTRAFGRDVDGNQDRSFYISYIFLITSLVSLYTLKSKNQKIFGALGILGIIATVYTKPLNYIPLGGAVVFSTYFLMLAVVFLSFIAGNFVYKLSEMKNGMRFAILILLLFVVDVWPAHSTFYWSDQPTENYVNTPAVMDAYNFVKHQPGLFRTYTLAGEMPFIYTEKSEIGTEWTGYREGAFKPIRDLTDKLYKLALTNISSPELYANLGAMGVKFLIYPCIKGFEQVLPLAYSNNQVCVYENPLFTPLVTSPEKIAISERPITVADAYILEPCSGSCILERKRVKISNIDFQPEKITFSTAAEENGFVIVKESFFKPHWHAYVNGVEVDIRKAWPYYMAIQVPVGINQIELRYTTNKNHIIARIITLLTALYILWLIIQERKRRR